jgi:DnaJ-domain-containing protein 1
MPPTPNFQTPEERELAAKKAELSELEGQLAERELALVTLGAELSAFEQRYIRIVGVKFAEIDELEAQIAQARARKHPVDAVTREQASNARAKAVESAAATGGIRIATKDRFTPSDELKRLYRDVAKRLHPDLAIDDDERLKRTRLMAEANGAYTQGDEARLRALLSEWETSPDAVKGEDVGAQLVRTIRKIHQVSQGLARIDEELVALKKSELFELNSKVDSAQQEGRDLLAEMATELEEKARQLRSALNQLNREEAAL